MSTLNLLNLQDMYVDLHQQTQRQAIRQWPLKAWKIKLGHVNGRAHVLKLTAMVSSQAM